MHSFPVKSYEISVLFIAILLNLSVLNFVPIYCELQAWKRNPRCIHMLRRGVSHEKHWWMRGRPSGIVQAPRMLQRSSSVPPFHRQSNQRWNEKTTSSLTSMSSDTFYITLFLRFYRRIEEFRFISQTLIQLNHCVVTRPQRKIAIFRTKCFGFSSWSSLIWEEQNSDVMEFES